MISRVVVVSIDIETGERLRYFSFKECCESMNIDMNRIRAAFDKRSICKGRYFLLSASEADAIDDLEEYILSRNFKTVRARIFVRHKYDNTIRKYNNITSASEGVMISIGNIKRILNDVEIELKCHNLPFEFKYGFMREWRVPKVSFVEFPTNHFKYKLLTISTGEVKEYATIKQIEDDTGISTVSFYVALRAVRNESGCVHGKYRIKKIDDDSPWHMSANGYKRSHDKLYKPIKFTVYDSNSDKRCHYEHIWEAIRSHDIPIELLIYKLYKGLTFKHKHYLIWLGHGEPA